MKLYRIAQSEMVVDNRKLGKSLFELGYKTSVPIYRAQNANSANIVDKDYVTLSYQFAIGHAKHMAASDILPRLKFVGFFKSKSRRH